MRRFTQIILAINLLAFAWLAIGAEMKPRPWRLYLLSATVTLDEFKPRDAEEENQLSALRARLRGVEAAYLATFEEYRRASSILFILGICNIAGLLILVLKRTNAQQAGSSNGG